MPLPTINLIGCGRLGTSLGYLLQQHQLGTIQNVYTRNRANTEKAVAKIGQGILTLQLRDFSGADFYFFCTPDDAIESSCQQLLQVHTPPKGSFFVHFSGALTSSILHTATTFGCSISSLHIARSFTEKLVTDLSGVLGAFEGDLLSSKTIPALFSSLGMQFFNLEPKNKILYHIGSVFASNYLIALTQAACECYRTAGVSEETAITLTLHLMETTLGNLTQGKDPRKALTGPLARGDIQTIERHLQALANPTLSALYKTLGQTILPLTHHTDILKEHLSNCLK